MSWKKRNYEKRMCVKEQIENQWEFQDLQHLKRFPTLYNMIHNIPLGVYTIKAGNFIYKLLYHCKQIYQQQNEYHIYSYRLRGNPVYFVKNTDANVVQGLTDEFFISFIATWYIDNWVERGELEFPEYMETSKNWKINYEYLSKWMKNLLADLIQVYVCNCSLAPAKDLKKETGLNKKEIKCLYTYFKTNSYKAAYEACGENVYKDIIGNINPDIDDNQFKIEAINLLWNEAEKCMDDYNAKRTELLKLSKCTNVCDNNILSQETAKFQKQYLALRKQMKELKFTF